MTFHHHHSLTLTIDNNNICDALTVPRSISFTPDPGISVLLNSCTNELDFYGDSMEKQFLTKSVNII